MLASNSSDSYVPSDLLAGDDDVVTTVGTIALGNNVLQYTVLGRVTATGEYAPWAPAATDGTEKAIAISAEAIDATAAAAVVPIYRDGFFNIADLVWPAGSTAIQQQEAFDNTSINVRDVRYSG